MNLKLNFDQARPVQTVAAATLATVIGLGMLWGTAALLQSRGEPFGNQAIAERACTAYVYRSEKQACVAKRLAEHAETQIAKR